MRSWQIQQGGPQFRIAGLGAEPHAEECRAKSGVFDIGCHFPIHVESRFTCRQIQTYQRVALVHVGESLVHGPFPTIELGRIGVPQPFELLYSFIGNAFATKTPDIGHGQSIRVGPAPSCTRDVESCVVDMDMKKQERINKWTMTQ